VIAHFADRLSDTELLGRVEATTWASDRTFFDQHPRRRFRVRPAFDVEIEDFARHDVALQRNLPAGLCWWVAVYHIHPGVRMRCPLAAPHDLPTEVPEEEARHVWTCACPPKWECKIRDLEGLLS
jgi:hypothetical protein